MVTKFTDQLILDIRGCVCGISSCTLKVVPQDSVSSRDMKVEQSTKLSWFVLAACTPSIPVPLSRWPRKAMFCRPHKPIISVIEQSFFLLFWMVSPSLSWINKLSRLPLILYESITDSNGIFVVLSSCMEITHFIHHLELVNVVSTSTPLPFCMSMLLEKIAQDSTHHSLANCKWTGYIFSNFDVESHDHLHKETCNQYQ